MRRMMVLLTAVCMLCLLSACGGEGRTEEAVASGGGAVSAPAETEAPEEPAEQEEPEAAVAAEINDAGDTQEIRYTDGGKEDGELLAAIHYQPLTIENAEDSAALALIQADIDQVIADFQTSAEEGVAVAQAEYDDPELSPFYAYEYDLTFQVARNDDRVLSLVAYSTAFTGGVHGNTAVICLNYDVSTGKRINMADFEPEFTAAATEEVLAQAEELAAGGEVSLFPDYADYIWEVVSSTTFYFSGDGVVFVAGQYVFQSYADGILFFTIPYDQINGYLPEAYQG